MLDDNNKNCSCAAILNRLKDAEEEIERLKQMPTSKGGRVKRKPSAYQSFLGDCMRGTKGDIQGKFKECVTKWKEQKK